MRHNELTTKLSPHTYATIPESKKDPVIQKTFLIQTLYRKDMKPVVDIWQPLVEFYYFSLT